MFSYHVALLLHNDGDESDIKSTHMNLIQNEYGAVYTRKSDMITYLIDNEVNSIVPKPSKRGAAL